MSDSNGLMMFGKLDQFLKEALKLPTAVFEGPSFGYTEHAVRTCFPQQVRRTFDTASGYRGLQLLPDCPDGFQQRPESRQGTGKVHLRTLVLR